MKRWCLPILAAAALLLNGCQKENTTALPAGEVQLHLTHVAGNNAFALQAPITNTFGESLTVTKYKYYISNIRFTDTDNKVHAVNNTYFLVDENNAASKTLTVNTDAATYKSVSFLLGVDSTRNVSGAQTGALDPMLDMFWTWNTGYIMAKLEGTSSLSSLPNNKLEYHIGGFKGEHNVLKTVSLSFSQPYTVEEGKTLSINISADVLQWFDEVHPLPVKDNPTCTSPGNLARRYADNYATMFAITSIQQQ